MVSQVNGKRVNGIYFPEVIDFLVAGLFMLGMLVLIIGHGLLLKMHVWDEVEGSVRCIGGRRAEGEGICTMLWVARQCWRFGVE